MGFAAMLVKYQIVNFAKMASDTPDYQILRNGDVMDGSYATYQAAAQAVHDHAMKHDKHWLLVA